VFTALLFEEGTVFVLVVAIATATAVCTIAAESSEKQRGGETELAFFRVCEGAV